MPSAQDLPVREIQLLFSVSLFRTTQPGGTVAISAFAVDERGGYQNVTSLAAWDVTGPATIDGSSSKRVRVTGTGDIGLSATYHGVRAETTLVSTNASRSAPYMEIDWSGSSQLTVGEPPGSTPLRATLFAVGGGNVTSRAEWSSSDMKIATVNAGLITSTTPGTVEITASYNGYTDTVRFSVWPPTFRR